MDQTRKSLLTFGFVRDYCKQSNVDPLPNDIIHLFVLWLSFCDQFDRDLTHKDIAIKTKTIDKYGECQQLQMEAIDSCLTAICKGIFKKGDKQSWTFQVGLHKKDPEPLHLVFGIIENESVTSRVSIEDFSAIPGGFGLYLFDMFRYYEQRLAGKFEYGKQYEIKHGDIITMELDLTKEKGILSFVIYAELRGDVDTQSSNIVDKNIDVNTQWRAAVALYRGNSVSLLPYDP